MCPNRLWFMKTKLKPGILWHPQKESRKTRTHVFPRRTKKENKYRWCTVCGPFYLPSSPRVEIIVKRSLLSIVILCISLVFSGFDGVPKFFKRQCAICQHWFSHCTVILRVVEQDWCICNYLCQTFFAQNEQSVVIIILESASIFSINRFYQQC